MLCTCPQTSNDIEVLSSRHQSPTDSKKMVHSKSLFRSYVPSPMVVERVFRRFAGRVMASSLGIPAFLLRFPRPAPFIVAGLFFRFFFDLRFVSSLAPHPTKDKTRNARSFISLCRAYARTLATNHGRGATRAILRSFLSKGFSVDNVVVRVSFVASLPHSGNPKKSLSVHNRTQILNL